MDFFGTRRETTVNGPEEPMAIEDGTEEESRFPG